MISTRRKIETEQDRYGGFSSTSPNVSYFSNTYSPQEESTEQQAFDFNNTDYPSYVNYEDQTQTSYNEAPSYTEEQSYSVGDISGQNNDELYQDFSIVKTFMPNVQKNSSAQSIQRKSKRQRAVLNNRGKIFVSMYLLVASLLVAFCIYNAVVIANLGNSLTLKNQELSQIQQQYTQTVGEYNDIVSEDNMQNIIQGWQPSDDNTITIKINSRPTYDVIEKSSNWFDKICDFLSSVF